MASEALLFMPYCVLAIAIVENWYLLALRTAVKKILDRHVLASLDS
jgi:hypothetical protein